jgi:hypothetical protein
MVVFSAALSEEFTPVMVVVFVVEELETRSSSDVTLVESSSCFHETLSVASFKKGGGD